MSKSESHAAASAGGFTLIELMITVAVVAILGTIAATAYTSQVQHSRRTDGRSVVMDLAGREEKLFSTTNAYSALASDLGYATGVATTFPMVIGSGYYSVNIVVATPSSYLITATAINSQANDAECLTLGIDQTGTQYSTGTGTVQTCWGN